MSPHLRYRISTDLSRQIKVREARLQVRTQLLAAEQGSTQGFANLLFKNDQDVPFLTTASQFFSLALIYFSNLILKQNTFSITPKCPHGTGHVLPACLQDTNSQKCRRRGNMYPMKANIPKS